MAVANDLESSRAVLAGQFERCIALRGVSWETYQHLLNDVQDSHAAHFTYDRGTLEIMVLSFKHELLNRALASIVEVVAEELGIDIVNAGSTTFKRQDLERGFEPDTGFYIRHAAAVHGKEEIDLQTDPPPDLLIEVEISHSSLDKNSIYAALGVPEVWRYDGKTMAIFVLQNRHYIKQETSAAFACLDAGDIARFCENSQTMKRTEWLRMLRSWLNNAREET